jgi:hypothetical protein
VRAEIAGCTGQRYDPTTEETLTGGVGIAVLHVSQRKALTYVLLLASAAPNCNLQGLCGASETTDKTLLWLCIANGHTLIKHQRVVVESCRDARAANIPEDDPEAALRFVDDLLRIEYEQGDPASEAGDTLKGLVEYDRRHPEAGLKVSGSPTR